MTPTLVKAALLAALVMPPHLDGAAAQALAQNAAVPGRDVLVAGTGAVATAAKPAEIAIDVSGEALPARPVLELSLTPVASSPSYLIVVSLKSPDGSDKRLGTVSFFPPRPGKAQSFYLDASPIVAEAKARRTTRLVLSVGPTLGDQAPQGDVPDAGVRILGARIVGK